MVERIYINLVCFILILKCEDPLRFVGVGGCLEPVVNVVAHQSGISNCRLSQSSVVIVLQANR